MVGGVESVFTEEGRNGEHLVTGFEHSVEEGVHGTGRAAGQDDMGGGDSHALLGRKPFGHLFAGPGKTAVGHIAEDAGGVEAFGKGGHGAGGFGRRGKVGVAEAEVAYGISAVFLAQFDTGLEHTADHRALRDILLHGGAYDGSGHGLLLNV